MRGNWLCWGATRISSHKRTAGKSATLYRVAFFFALRPASVVTEVNPTHTLLKSLEVGYRANYFLLILAQLLFNVLFRTSLIPVI